MIVTDWRMPDVCDYGTKLLRDLKPLVEKGLVREVGTGPTNTTSRYYDKL